MSILSARAACAQRDLHHRAASLLKLPQQPRQHLLHQLLNLVVTLPLLLLLLLATMLLLAVLPLVLPTLLLLRRRRRISAAIPGLLMRRLVPAPAVRLPHGRRRRRRPALEVDVDAPRVVLGRALQTQVAAQLLDPRLDLLHVAGTVVALADDGVQVRLAPGLVGPDALLEDARRLVGELAVQVDGVLGHAAGRVVLAEDVLGRLPVVVVHGGRMALALVAERLGLRAVAALVGLV